MTGAGVPAGASKSLQNETFRSAPGLLSVGTLGRSLRRSPDAMARALKRPPCNAADAAPASTPLLAAHVGQQLAVDVLFRNLHNVSITKPVRQLCGGYAVCAGYITSNQVRNEKKGCIRVMQLTLSGRVQAFAA